MYTVVHSEYTDFLNLEDSINFTENWNCIFMYAPFGWFFFTSVYFRRKYNDDIHIDYESHLELEEEEEY